MGPNQTRQQAGDSGGNGTSPLDRTGTGALGNALPVAFDGKGSSKRKHSGVTFDAAGLGLSAGTGDFEGDAATDAALTSITSATGQLRAQSFLRGRSPGRFQPRGTDPVPRGIRPRAFGSP